MSKEVIKHIYSNGLFLTADGYSVLQQIPEERQLEVINHAIKICKSAGILFIDSFIIGNIIKEVAPELVLPPAKEKIKKKIEEGGPLVGKEISPEIREEKALPEVTPLKPRIVKIENKIVEATAHPLDGYIQYFRSRYGKINQLFSKQQISPIPIAQLQRLPAGEVATIVGLIREKRERKSRIFLEVEDLSGSETLFIPESREPRVDQMVPLLIEDIVCAFTVKKGNINVVTEISFPEIPFRKVSGAEEEIYAILTSDFHFGSKSQLHELLNKFLAWLRGEIGTSEQREIAKKTRYLLIAGDIVEGIGVYPGQLQDLEIVNVREQYECAAAFLKQIPDYIDIIVSPGNHDATQQALPQPFPPEKFSGSLKELTNIHFASNPCVVDLHGVKILMFHGQSIEDIAQKVPGIQITTPIKALEFMVRIRHLAPVYGGKTPIAPQKSDPLVIDIVPHVLHVGHTHIYDVGKYRNILLVSSGAWQEQTEYQIKQGIVPTPGIVAALNLKTLEIVNIDFNLM